MFHISVSGVQDQPRVIGFKEQNLVIGRSDYCDLVIPDGYVSRQHLAIFRFSNKWIIQDLASSNGTFRGRTRFLLDFLVPEVPYRLSLGKFVRVEILWTPDDRELSIETRILNPVG